MEDLENTNTSYTNRWDTHTHTHFIYLFKYVYIYMIHTPTHTYIYTLYSEYVTLDYEHYVTTVHKNILQSYCRLDRMN